MFEEGVELQESATPQVISTEGEPAQLTAKEKAYEAKELPEAVNEVFKEYADWFKGGDLFMEGWNVSDDGSRVARTVGGEEFILEFYGIPEYDSREILFRVNKVDGSIKEKGRMRSNFRYNKDDKGETGLLFTSEKPGAEPEVNINSNFAKDRTIGLIKRLPAIKNPKTKDSTEENGKTDKK